MGTNCLTTALWWRPPTVQKHVKLGVRLNVHSKLPVVVNVDGFFCLHMSTLQ